MTSFTEAMDLDSEQLDLIHDQLMEAAVVDGSEELRLIGQENWPELLHKLKPPLHRMH